MTESAGYIFNTSFYVPESRFGKWQEWLQSHLFPATEKVVAGVSAEIFEVVSARPDESRIFSVQWRCHTIFEIEKLDTCVAAVLRDFGATFGEEATHFSSVMKRL